MHLADGLICTSYDAIDALITLWQIKIGAGGAGAFPARERVADRLGELIFWLMTLPPTTLGGDGGGLRSGAVSGAERSVPRLRHSRVGSSSRVARALGPCCSRPRQASGTARVCAIERNRGSLSSSSRKRQRNVSIRHPGPACPGRCSANRPCDRPAPVSKWRLTGVPAVGIFLPDDHGHTPLYQITFNRKQNSCPLSGSRRSASCTCSNRLAKPFLVSVWPLASHTRTPLGTGIMGAAFQAHA